MKHLEQEPRIIKTFESFLGKGKYDNMENLSKANSSGEVDTFTRNKILDVNNFNEWVMKDFNGYGYKNGAPELIGRIDKLSEAMIVSYFLDQGVECTEQEIREFQDKIRKEWLNKR